MSLRGALMLRGMRPLLWLAALPLFLVALLVLEANGPTPTTAMAFGLPLLCVLGALGRRRLAGAVVAVGLVFCSARFAAPVATDAQVCIGARCSNGRFWLERLIDEREATRAGLSLSKHLGVMVGREFRAFDALIDRSWSELGAGFRGLPNPLLMTSRPGHVESLRVRARGEGTRPAIVFLHGFGGLLTLYVEAIARGTHGEFDVIAPALDPVGAWWTEPGLAVVRETLDTLPPDVDRSRVYLVGLSNGGVGASAVLEDPELARRFAGVVLLSGLAPIEGTPATRVLVVSGENDPRFPHAYVQDQVRALRRDGGEVTWARFDADHFLLLTHANAWTQTFRDWARAPTREAGLVCPLPDPLPLGERESVGADLSPRTRRR